MMFQFITHLLALLLSGLIAGLFYAYSCSVNEGLSRLPDAEYLRAMQSINRVILNGLFMVSFLGTLAILPLLAWVKAAKPVEADFYLVLAAALLYLIAVFGVTLVKNVPLNEMLDKFNIEASSASEWAALRQRFEAPWNNWHQVRSIAAALCFLLVILACLDPRKWFNM